ELVLAGVGGDSNELSRREHVAGEGRQGGDPDSDRRRRVLAAVEALLTQLLFGLAGAAREVLDDFAREAGRQAAPGFGQEIDKQLFRRRDGADGDLASTRDANTLPVRVASGR